MSSQPSPGLTAAFTPSTATGSAPSASAVASLASRFDAPPPDPSQPAIGARVASIANRFGDTVDSKPVSSDIAPQKKRAVVPDVVSEGVVEDAVTRRGSVGEITKRFDKGVGGDAHLSQVANGDGGGHGFAAAKEAFRKREAAEQKPVEGRVSQFARRIDSGAKGDIAVSQNALSKKGSVGVESDAGGGRGGVSSVLSRFESGCAADGDMKGKKEEKSGNSVKERFENASKLFEKAASQHVASDQQDGDNANTRFLDASKMFGG